MLTFNDLYVRLLADLKLRIRNGTLTERGLAKKAGISQPHLHNVMKGVRSLTPATADRLMESLGMSVIDLLTPEELSGPKPSKKPEEGL